MHITPASRSFATHGRQPGPLRAPGQPAPGDLADRGAPTLSRALPPEHGGRVRRPAPEK